MEASAAQTAVPASAGATSGVEIPQYSVLGVLAVWAAYHLHEPWVFLSPLADGVVIAYPTKRYRSALIGIVHSAHSVVIIIVILTLVR